MAFADWTQFIDGNMSASLDVTNPINGNGSLLTSRTTTSTNTGNQANMHLNTGSFTVGLDKGRIRTLIQIEHTGVGSVTSHLAALIGFFYDGSFDTTLNSVNGYLAGWTVVADGDQALRIYKTDSNSSGANIDEVSPAFGNILGQVKPFGPLVDQDILPIEVEWNLDVPNLGGMRVTLRRGNTNDTDFVNLTSVIDLVDASPLSVSDFEGLVCYNGEFGGPIGSGIRWDDTTVSELL